MHPTLSFASILEVLALKKHQEVSATIKDLFAGTSYYICL